MKKIMFINRFIKSNFLQKVERRRYKYKNTKTSSLSDWKFFFKENEEQTK